jgi:hypothetical protein
MLTIGRLAERFGLSRSTLLYYDSIELLSPSARSDANYRLYSLESLGIGDEEVSRIRQWSEEAQTHRSDNRARRSRSPQLPRSRPPAAATLVERRPGPNEE